MPKKLPSDKLMRRYILFGAGCGLYFGLAFKPERIPSIEFVIMLSLIIALVMIMIPFFRGERPAVDTLIKDSTFNFLKYFFLLATLEARYLFYDYGGKATLISFTIVMGIIAGAWLAYEKAAKK